MSNRATNFTSTSFVSPQKNGTTPMNGTPKIPKQKQSDFEAKRLKLDADKAEIEKELKQIEDAEKAEQARIRANKEQQSIELRELAQQYDIWAKAEALKPVAERGFSPEHFLNLAREARREATTIEKEIGLNVVQTESVEEPLYDSKKAVIIQRIMLIALPVLSLIWFFAMRSIILATNATLPPDAAVPAYGLDSIQKIGFSFFVRATDLLLLYGITKTIAPMIADYLIPTKKSPKDAIQEFYNELTAWQRQLISALFVSAILLYLALSPSVKA